MYFFNLLEAFHHHNTALNNIVKLRINLWLDFYGLHIYCVIFNKRNELIYSFCICKGIET